MEKDENIYEEDLEVEVMDDDSDDEEDVEEYDFNDDDVEDAEEGEADNEADEATEEGEDSDGEEVEAQEEQKPEKPEAESAELVAAKERELKLLHKLGYKGTYEEASAAFEREQSENKGEDTDKGEDKPEEKPAESNVPDYEAMAKQMLEDINKEYGLNLTDFSKFEDLETFADLSRDERVGAVKAFAATNPKMMEEIARKAAISKLGKPQRNVQTLPKSDGGKGGVKGQTVSAKQIAEYQALFPGMSRSGIIKLLNRVNKNTR